MSQSGVPKIKTVRPMLPGREEYLIELNGRLSPFARSLATKLSSSAFSQAFDDILNALFLEFGADASKTTDARIASIFEEYITGAINR